MSDQMEIKQRAKKCSSLWKVVVGQSTFHVLANSLREAEAAIPKLNENYKTSAIHHIERIEHFVYYFEARDDQ